MRTLVRNQSGFSLIELMIGLVIVSVIWIGVAKLFASQVASSMANQDDTELQSAIQAVSHMINQDIVMSGFGMDDLEAFKHENNVLPGGDRLSLSTSAQFGSILTSVLMTPGAGTGSGGTEIWVRCFGNDVWGGGQVDPVRDFVVKTGGPTTLWVAFFDPFSGKRLASTPGWIKVDITDPEPGGVCQTTAAGQPSIDNNGDSINDPMVKLTLADNLTSNIPNGMSVYGVHWPTSAGTPDTAVHYEVSGDILFRNSSGRSMAVLYGVENFQVQYLLRGGTTWLNSLAGVKTSLIEQVRYALVVRKRRKEQSGRPDPRSSITLYDDSYDWAAVDADARLHERQRYEFFVRPKNNGILLELTPPI